MMKEIVLITILLVTIYAQTLSPLLEEKRKGLKPSTKMFQLPAGDQALLDEMNSVRRCIASGLFNDIFGKVVKLFMDGLNIAFEGAGKAVLQLGELIGVDKLYEDAEMLVGWGKKLVSTDGVLGDIASNIEDFGVDVGNKISKTWDNAKDETMKFLRFGRKKRNFVTDAWKRVEKGFNDFMGAIEQPKNVFGPATDMNLLTWNRRLAQLAMVKKEELFREKNPLTEVEYEGKMYRVTKYGTLATYVIRNILGEKIARMFQELRVGYLACQMWFGMSFPSHSEEETIHKTYEILFADRTEVGCYFTWPATFCLIGPLKTRVGLMYDAGNTNEDTCSKCKHGCTNSLCNPPPSYFYALRDKYLKHLRPKIEKFEVVEGFDGKPPPIGHNFMIDSSNYTNLLVIHAALIFLYHFIL
ncbi:unnamed protein product [Caenorhabditis brenneri]